LARPRTDIQPRIVQAARARFLAEGVDGASLRTIAADAGTSVGMIFYYYPAKDDLFLAVVEEFYAKLLEDISRALDGEDPVRERLKRAFARLGSTTDDEMAVVRLVAREALLSSERFQRIFARVQRGHLALLLGTLAEGVRDGVIDGELPAPLVLVATLALGGMPQLVRRATRGQALFSALPPPEGLAEASVELLFRAIAPRSAEKRRRTAPPPPRNAKKRR
jgi:AcrR family transcriptional regulator